MIRCANIPMHAKSFLAFTKKNLVNWLLIIKLFRACTHNDFTMPLIYSISGMLLHQTPDSIFHHPFCINRFSVYYQCCASMHLKSHFNTKIKNPVHCCTGLKLHLKKLIACWLRRFSGRSIICFAFSLCFFLLGFHCAF